MGTIFHRKGRWGINYRDPNGKQVRRMISEYKETAERVLKKTEMDIIEGRYLDKKKVDPIQFREFVQEFVENYINLENRHPHQQMGRVNIIRDYFDKQLLNQIDARMIRRFLSEKRETLKPATVNRYLSMIRCMFNKAREWKMLDGENPTNGMKKLPEDNERCRWLTDKDQAFLLSHCHGITLTIVMTALQTGLRWNEIMNLKWSQSPKSNYVDFDNNIIVIHSSWAKAKKARFIPLSYALRCELLAVKKTAGSEYIFVSPQTGKPFNNIRRSFTRAVREAGLKDLKFHDLRHVFASNLVRKGVDLYVVQQLLGHSTPKMTQRYAHIRPDHLKSAIGEIDLQSNQFSG